MAKPLNPAFHGVLDYVYGIFLILAPALFDFQASAAAAIFYIVGIGHISLSLITDYPLGIIKKVPFTAHAKVEVTAAVFLLISPWIFGFADATVTRNVFLAAGLLLAGVWSLTNYKIPAWPQVKRFDESDEERRAA